MFWSPNTETGTSARPFGTGQCQDAQFTATSNGPSVPIICGTNTGYHMILEAQDNCNTLSFTWRSATTRSWDVHIMQIPCTASWKPPDGCLQYFTGTTGNIYSYNYAGGLHLASQDYLNCVRTEQGYCSISYTAVSTAFGMSGPAPASISVVGDPCSLDYILIPAGGSTAGSTTNFDRFCGTLMSVTNAGTSAITIYTNRMPFQVGVITDGSELNDPAPGTSESTKGFNLYYSQTAC